MAKGAKMLDGSLKISEEVLLTITKQAILDVPGVDSLATDPYSFKGLLISSGLKKPIAITTSADVAQIAVSVNLSSGYKIREVAQRIQETVKSTVQNMTGVTVSKVNVYIAGVKKEEEQGA